MVWNAYAAAAGTREHGRAHRLLHDQLLHPALIFLNVKHYNYRLVSNEYSVRELNGLVGLFYCSVGPVA